VAGENTLVAGNFLSNINRVVQARIESNLGLSSGDDFAGDRKLWLKPFGSWSSQSDRDNVSGYKGRVSGLMFGADATVFSKANFGVAFAYGNAKVDSNSSTAPQSETIGLYQLIGYGSVSLDPATHVHYQVDAGNNRNSGQRNILFSGQTAASTYRSLTGHAGLGIERVLALSPATSFVPSVRVDYTSIHDTSYTETGAGALNLNVASHSTTQLVYSADGKLTHTLSSGLKISANAGIGYDLYAKQAVINAAYAGAPGMSFTTLGITPSHWTSHGGFGLLKTTSSGMEVAARYDVEGRTGYVNQTVSLKMRWSL